MLSKSAESGHLCNGPGLKGKAFSFSPTSMILAVSLLFMAIIMLGYIVSIPSLVIFDTK